MRFRQRFCAFCCLFFCQIPKLSAEVTVADIIAGLEQRAASLQNAEVELSIAVGRPETQQIIDHARVSWLNEDGKQEILNRRMIRNNETVERPTNRVTAVTSSYAYVIERANSNEEWRVTNTAMASQSPLDVGVRFNRITSWKTRNTAVDGFDMKALLTRAKELTIQEKDDDSLLVDLSPASDVGAFPIEAMQIRFDRKTFAILAFQYVYTAKLPNGSSRYVLVSEVFEGTKEWENRVYYPTRIEQSSSDVKAPALDAGVTNVNSIATTEIVSVRANVVQPADFLPSVYGLPNHIVGIDQPESKWGSSRNLVAEG